MAIQMQRSASSDPETAATSGLRSTFAGFGHALTAARQRVATPMIDSLEVMYHTELHDLQSTQFQACTVAEEIWVDMHDDALAQRVSDYAAQMRLRHVYLEDLLAQLGPETRLHPDKAMRALARETSRIADTCSEDVRDAAWTAALQRIIHQMIAGYGTVAAHAKALGRTQEAARFAECADQEKAADAELSALAKNTLNLQAMARRTND